jgi:hypothetical protein
MMGRRFRSACAFAAAAGLAGTVAATFVSAAQRNDQSGKDAAKEVEAKRPKIVLRVQPVAGVAPLRVVLTGELQGGADDFEEYYCPTVEWAWGDDTTSESTIDCDPYEAGKSQIKRRFTVEHVFRREGGYKVYLHLKRKDKILASASTSVSVQPGLGDGPR